MDVVERDICDRFSPQQQHYGHANTSRVDSAHAALKRWIGSSTTDALYFNSAIKLACDGQLARIKLKHAKERATFDMRFGNIFTDVMENSRKMAYSKPFANSKIVFYNDVDDNLAVIVCQSTYRRFHIRYSMCSSY